MSKPNFYIFAFATFGHPNDFRQSPFSTISPDLAKKIKVFDLSNAIKVFPNSTIYSIRKESIDNVNLIAYSIYTYAQEMASKRDGTFIGSSIILENQLSEESLVVRCLNEFHQKLIDKNLQDGVLLVNHSKDFASVGALKDFDKIANLSRKIQDLNFSQTNKSLVVFCETSPEKIPSYFKRSADLLNVYDTIYFTQSREVGEYVNQKSIYPLIQNVGENKGFENEIQKLAEEKLHRLQVSLDEFAREKQRLEEDKKRFISEYETLIARNESEHQQNKLKIEASRVELNQIKQNYDAFLKKMDEFIRRLKEGEKADSIKLLHNENKRIFISSIDSRQKPEFINSISIIRRTANLPTELPSVQVSTNKEKRSTNKRKQGVDVFKVATLFLIVLLIGTFSYILFKKPEKEIVYNDTSDTALMQQSSAPTLPLNPVPNNRINENDIRKIALGLTYDFPIDIVVKVIFDRCPQEVKSSYLGQEEAYGKEIINLNRNCFEQRGETFYFVKDTLKNIPSFKK